MHERFMLSYIKYCSAQKFNVFIITKFSGKIQQSRYEKALIFRK